MPYSNWVSLQQIVGANKAKGQEMGQRTAQSVDSQAANASSDINHAVDDVSAQAKKAGDANDPNAPIPWTDSGKPGTQTPGGHQFTQVAPTDAQMLANSQKGYSGPNGELPDTVAGQVRDAVDRVNSSTGQQVASTYGQAIGSNGYTLGANSLDSLLAGGSTYAKAMAANKTKWGGLQDQLGLGKDQAAAAVTKAKAQSEKNAQGWGDKYKSAKDKEAADAQAAADATKAHEAAWQTAQHTMYNPNATPEEDQKAADTLFGSQGGGTMGDVAAMLKYKQAKADWLKANPGGFGKSRIGAGQYNPQTGGTGPAQPGNPNYGGGV